MTRARRPLVLLFLTCSSLAIASVVSAHDGPPYPIVSNQLLARYRVSVWTDPDTTDDGSAGGQFWVMIDPARSGDTVPPDVQAIVTIRPLDRTGGPLMARAVPVNQDPSRQFATLVMDHEGRFAVHVDVDSASGRVSVDAEVQATYDLRPSRFLLVIYLLPFVLAGFLWTTLLVRRRRAYARAVSAR
jgi:hypothetical protein